MVSLPIGRMVGPVKFQEVDMQPSFTVAALVVTVLATSVSAQWPSRPEPGVPKGPDGKPDLSAAAPRTADGKPDFSGIWMRTDGPDPAGSAPGRPPRVTVGNAGAGLKGGLPFQPWAADLQ